MILLLILQWFLNLIQCFVFDSRMVGCDCKNYFVDSTMSLALDEIILKGIIYDSFVDSAMIPELDSKMNP